MVKSRQFYIQYGRLLGALFGGYKLQIVLLIVLGFLSGLFGGLGIGVVIPLFSFAVRGGTLGTDFISRTLSHVFAYFNIEPSITVFLALISTLFIIKAGILLIFGWLTARMSSDYEEQTINRLYRLVFSADWPFLSRQKIGHLQNLLTVNISNISRLMLLLSTLCLDFANFLVFFVLALKLSFFVTLVAFGLGAFIIIGSRPLLRRSRSYSRAKSRLNADIAHEVNENVMGIRTIKAMSVDQEAAQRGFDFFRYAKVLKVKAFMVKTINKVAIEPLNMIFMIILFTVLYQRPQFDFGVFAVITYAINKIFTYVDNLQTSLHAVSASFQYVDQVTALQKAAADNQESRGGSKPFHFNERIEFRGVGFSYGGDSVPALTHVDFSVRKGEMIGIIGPSGAGKTTITDLLVRLLRPSRGAIFVDGENIEEIGLKEWRRRVGYVSQDIFLKNDTIANNIRFYDRTIRDEEVLAAARMAYMEDLLSRLPQGLETVVGERGVRLSGGERQRVALARCFARSPEILVLDEATSALDHESEIMIKKAIADLKGKITIITIAHRLTTVMHADRLIIIRDGRMVEEGTPYELLKNADSYFYQSHHIIGA